jgi:hypothetical protein
MNSPVLSLNDPVGRGVGPTQVEQTLQTREETKAMKNVEMKVEGNVLTIKVDLSKEFGPASSGKTIIIASTQGNVPVNGAEEI